MSVLAPGLLGAASLLLLVAGAAKAADPSRTVGALAALGWPSPTVAVRAGAVAEAVLGALGLLVGGAVVALLVAASFAGFALFVAAALRAGTPVGTCGCFAREDTPPHPRHVAVDGALAVAAVAAAVAAPDPLVDAPVASWALAAALAAAAYVALTASVARRPAGDGGAVTDL
ncbi:MAG TPA: MauE/DoxX family redox-associated membrane protein [Acidimicrobiales bacterium]